MRLSSEGKNRGISLLLAAALALSVLPASAAPADEDEAAAVSAAETTGVASNSAVPSYEEYLETYAGQIGAGVLTIPAAEDYTAEGEGVEVQADAFGQEGDSLYMPEGTTVAWNVTAETAGLYTLKLRYYPAEGKGVELERSLTVNGSLPYEEAGNLLFPRVWGNAVEEIQTDVYGNDIRPSQKETPVWLERYCRDSNGYYTGALTFYLEAGENTIALEAVNEPMLLHSLTLAPPESPPSYEKTAEDYTAAGLAETQGECITIQGEDAVYKSSATLYPMTDRTSPATEPYTPSLTRLNTIGGSRWSYPGEFLTWTFTVPKSGLYRLALKVRQNTTSGIVSSRRILIDGEVPFAEMDTVSFHYGADWQSIVLGGEEPYLFYLEEGTHELRMEVALGEMGEVLREAEDVLLQLNRIYREILIITGSSPDLYRDYKLDDLIPDSIENLHTQYDRLMGLIASLQELTGETSNDNIGVLKTVARQLKSMYENPDKIARKFSYFKTNIGSLGTWLNTNHEQPLEIDYITVYSPDQTLKKPNAGFFDMLVFHVRNFLDSFIVDYNAIGNMSTETGSRGVTVWISSGRDQCQTLKSIINDSFVPQTGISADLQLVAADTLLSATIAGIGPDVALGVGMGDPVNYALRGALADLSQFEDFREVQAWFNPELFVPYRLTGGVYALPETQSFPMLFYRADILAELGLSVPRTWNEVISAISVLNKQNMEFGLSNVVDVNIFYLLLMQNGGSIYNEAQSATVLDSDAAVSAFKQWTNFYVNYKVSQEMDILNRFRVGEVPIAISDYSLYNSLQVSAPEIKGLWAFTPVPGVERDDGTIDNSAVLSSTACVIMDGAGDKEAAWSFLRWWTSADTQTRYGTEMESILGESARYPAANLEAFSRLPWSTAEYAELSAQLESARGIEQVPGSYYLSRHITNAFRQVVLHDKDAKDTLLDYVYIINEEITNKRKEFHLS